MPQQRVTGTGHTGYRVTTPREAALRILARRFPESHEAATGSALDQTTRDQPTRDQPTPVFTLTGFQHDAVRRAHLILARRRGVLIADSVGLGKTYIALALIEAALRDGDRVGVVTPAALRRNWMVPLRELEIALGSQLPGPTVIGPTLTGPTLPGECGPSTTTQDTRTGPRTPHLVWTSHTRLGRGTAPEGLYQGLDLVVVDEAHAFRNPRTRRYRALAELARATRLVLLTATPVNNSPADLYHLIRLFAGDGDFHDLGIPDLRETIRAISTAPRAGQVAPSLHPLLGAIMIRRTRALVSDGVPAAANSGLAADPEAGATDAAATPALSFPHRAPPCPVHYTLAQVYDGFLPDLAATLADLTLAPFRLAAYGATLPGTATTAPDELIRIGLLKRLESSLAAFHASVARQLRFTTAFVASLDRGLLRLPADQRALFARGDELGAQLSLEELTLRPLPPGLDLLRLRYDTESDRQRLDTLHRHLSALATGADPDAGTDPKLARLMALLDGELRGEKVVIFTEFRETARYLWRALRHRGATALIDGGGAFLGNDRAGRQEVITRFAPHANHTPPPPPHERVDLLLATDVLAEGLNLQDARNVISYDLPWNPVRLMQRIGRVDRIGSRHQTVFPYHFLPDQGLEELLRLVDRLQLKLTGIRQTIGEEFAMVRTAGEATAVTAEDLERADLLAAGAEEILRAAYHRALRASTAPVRAEAPRGAEATRPPVDPPITAALPGPPGSTQLVLVACRIAERLTWLTYDPASRTAREDDALAAEVLLGALTAEGDPPPPAPVLLRQAWLAARKLVRERLAATSTPPPLPTGAPGARAARRILGALSALPGGPDPELCRQADKLLPLLARRHDAGTEMRILSALRTEHPGVPDLIHSLEMALEHAAEPPRGSADGLADGMIELVGIIERRPSR